MKRTQHFGPGFVFVIATLLLCSFLAPAHGSGDGQAIFKEKCASCHAMEPHDQMTIKERLEFKGTPLWFAGSKFQRQWLEAWLAAPTPLLGVVWNTAEPGTLEHPAISPDEAAKVTDYLMTAVDASVEPGKAAELPENRTQRRKFLADTAQLFEKHQGCFSCHRYLNKRNVELGGFSAPSLVTAKDRLQGDWVYSFLLNPGKYYPNSKCPVPGEKAVNTFSDEDKANLAGFVVNIGER